MKPKLIAALIATLLFTAAPAELYAATCRGLALPRMQELQVLQALRERGRDLWRLQEGGSRSG